MRIFWKNGKNRLRIRTPVLLWRLGLRLRTLRYYSRLTQCYYNFVEFISGAKMRFITIKKNKITTVNVLILLLPHFCTYFSLQTLKFLLTGGVKIFLAPGRRVP